ncbi:MAG: ChbG/HpnK family deacetylase, partial [Planctomycetales bacterium]|nr:ChbG/HpnK family deacetylase [Planctomycetales bacterium]
MTDVRKAILRSAAFLSMIMLMLVSAPTVDAAPPRLIVRGDDMGFSHAGNEAIVQCFRDGIETSVEVIVPSPWFPEAVELLAKYPNIDVGVHLALTSEWENLKWRPISHAPSLCDENGYFYPMIFPNKNYPGRSLRENDWKLPEIEQEFRAQIEMAKRRIPRISHLSGHMGCAFVSDNVKAVYRKLAREYGVELELDEQKLRSVTYVGPKATAAEKLTSFLKML